MIWIVETYKQRPTYVRGDLSSETILLNYKLFTSRKAAKAYIERHLFKNDYRNYVKDGISFCCHVGSKSWIEENTAATRYEPYTYKMFKCKPNSD